LPIKYSISVAVFSGIRSAVRVGVVGGEPKDVFVLVLNAVAVGVAIAATRMIAAGAAGNVRAAMADLEMWLG
jgi:hypothetical protein